MNPHLRHKFVSYPPAMMSTTRNDDHSEAAKMERVSSMMDLLDRFKTEENCVEYLYEVWGEDG